MRKKTFLILLSLLLTFVVYSFVHSATVSNLVANSNAVTTTASDNISIYFIAFLVLFFVLFPVFVIFLETKNKVIQKIGGLLICYGVGILIGNIGILPDTVGPIQNMMTTLSIPIAIPLIFFSMDLKKWTRLAKKSSLALVGQILSVSIIAFTGYFIFRNYIGADTWKISGMFIGVYTGGTVNLASIQSALQLDQSTYVALHTSDIIVSSIYLLFFISIGQKVYQLFLPKFDHHTTTDTEIDVKTFNSFEGMLKRENIKGLLFALLIAVLIFGVGGGISFLFPSDYQGVVAILVITSLSIIASFIPTIRKIKYTYQFGQYFILVFCLVVGSMSDFELVINTAPLTLLFTAYVVVGSMILHILFAKIFKIDADTIIITSTAGINSPPMVPMVASALKNKEIVVTGILTGIIGWMIGNYLGIGFAYLIKWISGA